MRMPEDQSQLLHSSTKEKKSMRSFEDQQHNGSYESSERPGRQQAQKTNVTDMMAKTQNKKMQEMLARY